MESGPEKGRSELRRANIVYFLSHNGVVEHPHLIRVHHLHNSGIHLRDVKRWLAELRGKDMPDSFAWSYKRKYRNGYIWEDLKNDDLITPISDNEYVLKGSYLLSHALEGLPSNEIGRKEKVCKGKEHQKLEPESILVEEEEVKVLEPQSELAPNDGSVAKLKHKPNNPKQRITLLKIDASKTRPILEEEEVKEEEEKADVAKVYKRSNSSKAFNVLRNILSCRKADTDESALLSINSRETHSRRRSTSELPDQSSRKNMLGNDYYRPVRAPNCSLCGQAFEPRKMVSHMKSCEGLTRRGKEKTNTTEKTPLRNKESRRSF